MTVEHFDHQFHIFYQKCVMPFSCGPDITLFLSRHKTLNQCWTNVKPTLIQRLVSDGFGPKLTDKPIT